LSDNGTASGDSRLEAASGRSLRGKHPRDAGWRCCGAIRFSLFGVADLAAALSIGFLAGLGPVQVFRGAASTLPLAQLPLALIPTVGVPAAIALHVVTLTRLGRHAPAYRRHRATASRPNPHRPDPYRPAHPGRPPTAEQAACLPRCPGHVTGPEAA